MGWIRRLFYGESSDDNDSYLARLNGTSAISGAAPEKAETSGESERPNSLPPAPNPYQTSTGQKIIPEVEVERLEAHLSGDNRNLELWAHIRNHADFDIELDKYEILGQRGDLQKFLKPGEIFELRIYRGDTPRNNYVRKMYIQFKVVGTGDYFQADHQIQYQHEQDGDDTWYIPEELELLRPIRDI